MQRTDRAEVILQSDQCRLATMTAGDKKTHRAELLVSRLVHILDEQDQSLVLHEVFAHRGMWRKSLFARFPTLTQRSFRLVLECHVEVIEHPDTELRALILVFSHSSYRRGHFGIG